MKAPVALRRLAMLPIIEHDPAIEEAYERSAFGHGWDDLDKDGQNARAEALILFHRQGRTPLRFATDDERRVVEGWWKCRFTGKMFTDASALDIDHIVPLHHAWVSGASYWTEQRRERYANGYGIKNRRRSWLVPVSASANRSKGAKGPSEWWPPNRRYWKQYAALWVATKRYWALSVTKAEHDALAAMLR